MQFPIKYKSKRNDCNKWCIPGYWCTNLIIVYTLFLGEASSNESCFVLFSTFVSCRFYLIQPFGWDNWLASRPGNCPTHCSSWWTCIHPTWHLSNLQLVSFIKQRRFSIIKITYQSNITCKPLWPFSFFENSWKGLQDFLLHVEFPFNQVSLLLIGGSSRDLSNTSASSNTESWSIGSSWLSSLWKSKPEISAVEESGLSLIWNSLDLLKTTSSWKVISRLTYLCFWLEIKI